MKIRKKEPSIGILGKIINSFSSSKQDAYSADYVNNTLETLENNLNNNIAKIIEVGKNENGSYVKYDNGYMECSHTMSTDTQDTASHYQSGTWTYPATFVITPDVIGTPYNWNTNAYFVKVNPRVESSQVMQQVYSVSSNKVIDKVGDKVCLKASGWWKLPEGLTELVEE